MKLRITAIALAIAAALLAGCAPAGTQTQDTTATPAPTQTQAPAKEASVKAGENYRILIWDNYNENDWVLNNRSGRAGEIKKRWEAFQQQYGISIPTLPLPAKHGSMRLAPPLRQWSPCATFSMRADPLRW